MLGRLRVFAGNLRHERAPQTPKARFRPPPGDAIEGDAIDGDAVDGDAIDEAATQLFEGGPPAHLETQIGLIAAGRPNIALRTALVVLIGWLPLPILAAIETAIYGDDCLRAFMSDYAVQARLLVAAPLLVVAERSCLPRLSAIAGYFKRSGLIVPEDTSRFARAVQSTLRLRDSVRFEIGIIVVTLLLVVAIAVEMPKFELPEWYRSKNLPLAALWHEFVSVPLLILLLLGWAWRLVLWARFLAIVARLKLRLVAAHPDRAAGLRFLGDSLPAFAPVAFALGVIVAGTVANRVTQGGVDILAFRYVLVAFVIIVAIVFVSPLVTFSAKLASAWRRGTVEYGALAQSVGDQFERRWLGRAAGKDALEANDFSATTDLYSITANVHAMNVVPFGLREIIAITIATLLPFVPVVAMAISPTVLFGKLVKLMF